MTSTATASQPPAAVWKPPSLRPPEAHWDLAFLGLLLYLLIDFTRLPAMFPFLEGWQTAKIAVALSAVGLLMAPPPAANSSESGRADMAVMGFMSASIVATILARFQTQAWAALFDTFRWGVIYLLVSRVLSNAWRLRVFGLFYILLNFKLAQFCIRTYMHGRSLGVSEEDLARGLGAGSTGWFGNSNDFGVAMCVAWPIAGFLIPIETSKFWRWVLIAAFVTIFGGLLLSGSRGSLLGAAATAVVVWIRNPRRLVGPVMAALLLIGGYFLMPQANKERVLSAIHYKQDANAEIRLRLWRAGMEMFQDHPFFGVGPRNFAEYYARSYGKDDPHPAAWAPHSIYIQATAELGLLGTIPFLLLVFLLFWLNSQTMKRCPLRKGSSENRQQYYLALGLNAALAAYLVNGATITVLYYPYLWILAGLTVALHRVATSKLQAGPQPPVAAL